MASTRTNTSNSSSRGVLGDVRRLMMLRGIRTSLGVMRLVGDDADADADWGGMGVRERDGNGVL